MRHGTDQYLLPPLVGDTNWMGRVKNIVDSIHSLVVVVVVVLLHEVAVDVVVDDHPSGGGQRDSVPLNPSRLLNVSMKVVLHLDHLWGVIPVEGLQ